MIHTGVKSVLILSTLIGLGGCATKTQTGAVAGGAGGAAVGGLIGSGSHGRAGEGALIGGAIGAIGGALIGNAADKEDERVAAEKRQYERDRERERAYYRSTAPTPTYGSTYGTNARAVTKEEVIAWSSRGTKDEIIIDRIEQSGARFSLTAADENKLRDSGVSPEVIRAMKETARR